MLNTNQTLEEKVRMAFELGRLEERLKREMREEYHNKKLKEDTAIDDLRDNILVISSVLFIKRSPILENQTS